MLPEADSDDPEDRRRPLRERNAQSRTFRARPTNRTGRYRARVVFPRAGNWRYEVYDGFTEYGGARTHRFAPVKIASQDT